MDGPEAKPFYLRCVRLGCPGNNATQTFAEADVAMAIWNRRVVTPPASPQRVADLWGFTKKSLIRGEMICLSLDRTGVFQSDAVAFDPHSKPLMLKPREW